MIDILRFLKNSGDDIIFFLIIAVVVFLFLKDFELASKRSWAILFGLVALGGFFAIRSVKKNKLLKEMEEREAGLKEMEKRYETLQQEHKITREKYELAKSELERAKVDVATSVLSAEEEYKCDLEKIQREQAKITPAELLLQAKEIIRKSKR
jgi:hypothetical protein